MLKLRKAKRIGGNVVVPGDKSIAHRAALLSILSRGPITIKNWPGNDDCNRSLAAARQLGVTVTRDENVLILTPPEQPMIAPESIIDCGNSGTTARLLAGLLAGSNVSAILSGDESLSSRPMARVIEPLTAMGADIFATNNRLPIKIAGKKLLPFEYRLQVSSAQVKSALLLAGLSSHCTVTVREDTVTRDHTENMIAALGDGLVVREVKAQYVPDPDDPRKKKSVVSEPFKKEITLTGQAHIDGGEVDIPGDISTAAFFFALAAMSEKTIAVPRVGLNSTRTGILEHLRAIGCQVEVEDRKVISGEPRGNVIVTGGKLKPRRLHGETVVDLIDEIPIVAVMAALADGTTIIRDAGELRHKESDRLATVAENLQRMGIKCGLLEDGLAIEGGKELQGADLKTYGDHRIAMAFAIAAQFAVGPSTLDDESVVGISCPTFFELLHTVAS
ncbi:3-phosphoshikimate 1-carboxyvinyltransferase [candidate division GN15 bacterium]|uniref:3-phosphoshikimate 1-carboxyvinyltransferase n=1 Tax=candidate division GN15 bacterium TaxID=2072418 RepID=A0A855XCH5_9BACT|nr:MAG: 3-phosphoshikimate 1-carboxyvinyltransferase [candidate division GN15 bacterium]